MQMRHDLNIKRSVEVRTFLFRFQLDRAIMVIKVSHNFVSPYLISSSWHKASVLQIGKKNDEVIQRGRNRMHICLKRIRKETKHTNSSTSQCQSFAVVLLLLCYGKYYYYYGSVITVVIDFLFFSSIIEDFLCVDSVIRCFLDVLLIRFFFSPSSQLK